MDALLKRVEVQAVAPHNDDLPVDDTAPGHVGLHGRHDLREVSRHRPLVAAAELDLVAVAEHDCAETIPLGLDEPDVRYRRHRLGEHGRDGRHHGQAHHSIVAARATDVSAAITQGGRPASSG